MLIDPVEILKELIAIPSVSPMRSEPDGVTTGESRLTAFLEKTLTQIGLKFSRQAVLPNRENVIGVLEGDVPPAQGGRVVLLDAHQDTVPVDGMTIEPFCPKEQDGRIYGRGACDVKGGMAAILAAVSRLAHDRPAPLPTVMVAFTADEESGFRGAAGLTEPWAVVDGSSTLPRPDATIVLEPTGLNIIVAHKGMIRWPAHVHGLAAHSARPELGTNAIYGMARLVTAIEQYAEQLAGGETDPYCGAATISVGTIHGGAGVNTVPDRCTIEIDMRPLPGDDPLAARQRVLDHLATTGVTNMENEPSFAQGPSLDSAHNEQLADRLAAVVNSIAGDCQRLGMPCCTNAPFYEAIGSPAVVFGPGFLDQAHTDDEWIPVDQLRQATDILYEFCRTLLDGSP